MEAIILAAGKGTRLLPLTENRPKHLLEVGGKAILKWQLDELLSNDSISKIIIVVNYKADMIREAVNSWTKDNRIEFIDQQQTNGTGDAVNTGLELIDKKNAFLVVNGDVLLDGAITHMINGEYTAAILGAKVSQPELFGVLKHENGKLSSIDEKPVNADKADLINAGLYIFPPEAYDLFANLKESERGEKELTDVVQQLIDGSVEINVVSITGEWFDVGHPWQILDANEYLLDKHQDNFKQSGIIEKGATLIGNVHVAENARVRAGVYIEGPVFIDEGADIGPNCYIRARSYIGRNVRVGNACEIKNCVIYRDTHAAHLSYIGDSVLGEYSNLGAGTITANLRHDGKNIKMTIKENRVNTGRRKLGIIMGDMVKTGIGVSLLPGIKIRGGKWINAHDFITRDVE